MLDSHNRNITYMRLSVTDLCNLRCKYCMPENGICKKNHDEMLTEEEMIQAIEVAADLGVKKLRITGGEPLVKRNIISICKRAHNTKGIEKIAITTNGLLLPTLGKELKDAGVEYINISLDTLNPDKYHDITRIGNLDEALSGIKAALAIGFKKVKINAVLIKGFNDDEIRELAELTLKYPLDVRFIELMPMVDDRMQQENGYISNNIVLEKLPELQEIENEPGSPSKLYRLPNALGNVGLISPISSCFCAECNRIRLTADGKIKPCLHSSDEIRIKGLDKAEMKAAFEKAILNKPEAHSILSSNMSGSGRSMNQIGG